MPLRALAALLHGAVGTEDSGRALPRAMASASVRGQRVRG